jgi:hypothetical protein
VLRVTVWFRFNRGISTLAEDPHLGALLGQNAYLRLLVADALLHFRRVELHKVLLLLTGQHAPDVKEVVQ